ncbi:peptidase M14 carboxypeptidase A [Bacillus freudenreichii]|nr:peptidase M14 carboxypeptidase A [Bacillus freudenreichii]
MSKFKKVSLYLVVFILIAQSLPAQSFAVSGKEVDKEIVVLFSKKQDEKINIFKDDSAEEVATEISDGTEVELIESGEVFSLVHSLPDFQDEKQEEEWSGYVHNLHVIPTENADEFQKLRAEAGFDLEKYQSEQAQESLDHNKEQVSESNHEIEANKEKSAVEEPQKSESKAVEKEQSAELTEDKDHQSIEQKSVVQRSFSLSDDEEQQEVPTIQSAVALKSPTKIYAKADQNAKVLKSYKYGSILKYRTFTRDWHEVKVYISGQAHTGYLKATDVGNLDIVLKSYALVDPVHVYNDTNRNSSKLKSYKIGHLLQFKAYNATWYQAKVYVNGKAQTGYIHRNDVGPNAPILQGYALQNPTYIYASTSTSSTKLKTYRQGQLLKFRPHNSNWYIATVYLNGKARTGYIYKKNIGSKPPVLSGHAKHQPTYVYSKTARNSAKLKSYKKGHLLKFYYYNSSWYKAIIIVNGKKRTGYINIDDVGKATDISFVDPHRVYSYSHMAVDMASLQKAYPDLIKYKVVGKSEYGRNIYAVSLGKGKPTAFINGSHHAREWLTTNLNMYMIEQYAKAYEKNTKIQGYDVRKVLNETTIWFMPMVNPDGVTLQQQGLKAFPKSTHASLIVMNNGSSNFKRWKANAKGVDLNRQYDAGWATIAGSPGRPSYKNYKGKAPATAAEVKAVLKLDAEIDPEIAVAYHTSGKILYWNYKQTGAAYNRDHAMAKTIGKMTGYGLVYPKSTPSGGGYTDWFIQARKRPGFTPEISKYYYETSPPLSEFSGAWRENQAVGLYVAQESAKLHKARKK